MGYFDTPYDQRSVSGTIRAGAPVSTPPPTQPFSGTIPTRPPSAGMAGPADAGEAAGAGVLANAFGHVGNAISSGLQRVAGDAPTPTAAPNAVVGASVLTPRVFAPLAPVAAPAALPAASLADAAMRRPGLDPAMAPNSASNGTSTQVFTQQDLDALPKGDPVAAAKMQADYQGMLAQENQDAADNSAAMRNNAAWAGNWTARQQAQGENRVAQFLAQNGVFSGGTYRGVNQGRQAAIAHAAETQANLDKLTEEGVALTGKPNPTRPYIQDFAKTQATENAAQGSAVTGQAAATALQTAQLNLKMQQSLAGLRDQLTSETDPAKLAQIQNSILVMLGKNPQDYSVTHAQGATYFDPNNPSVPLKQPDTIVITNKRSGQSQVVGLGGGGSQAPAGGYPTPGPQSIAMLRSTKNSAAFDARFGPGAAAKILGQ